MSHNSSRRVPTPFHYIASDARSDDSRTVLSSPRTSRSSTSTAVSSWIDDGASRTSSPSPSQWVGAYFPLPPTSTHPPHPPSPDAAQGLAFPPPALPATYAGGSPYPPTPPHSYAYPAASDHGSVSSPPSASSAPARSSSGAADRQEAKEGGRPINSVPCQVCLEPEIMCRCGGDGEARLRMRFVAKEVFDRGPVPVDNRLVAPLPAGGHAQGYAYVPGYGAPIPVVYAGGPMAGYPGRAVAAGGYAAGYYPSPGSASTWQTGFGQQQGPSGRVTNHDYA